MRSFNQGALAVVAASLVANAAFAGGDVTNGKAIFGRTCENCHSTQIGVNKIGPSLWGILDRRAGSVPDFNYSDALKASNQAWDQRTLDVYLSNPRGTLHGVKMYFKGLPAAEQRADVISYLATLK
jgi:cytochrome c